MNRPLVVLFDIDETLVHTGGSGARSWAWAFDQLHGVAADIGAHTSAGDTPLDITSAHPAPPRAATTTPSSSGPRTPSRCWVR